MSASANAAAAAGTAAPASESEDDLGSQQGDTTQAPQSASGAVPAASSIESVMLLLTQLLTQMPANMAAAMKVDKPNSHLDNAKLDVRNFTRIKSFTNKHRD